jgi:hypothetical protein
MYFIVLIFFVLFKNSAIFYFPTLSRDVNHVNAIDWFKVDSAALRFRDQFESKQNTGKLCFQIFVMIFPTPKLNV